MDDDTVAAGIPGKCSKRNAAECTTKKGVCGCNSSGCQLVDCILDNGTCKCPDPPGP